MEKVWDVQSRKFDDLIEQLLYNRGVIQEKERNSFLSPNFLEDLHDPFLMKGIKQAVERIKQAKEHNEVVGIFADYDADGIPGAALLFRALKALSIKPIVYIPNREKGYGLSKEGIDYLISKRCSLIITIDLGIRSIEEAIYCKTVGVDLIISDHHLPGEKLPSSDILINPKQKNDTYPCKDLCGCGVVYKLVQGLAILFPKYIDQKFLKWNLDLVAISTICDVVPLADENRVLAKFGLVVINKTKNLGLQSLIRAIGLTQNVLTAYHIGFQVGPRINAPGRIDHATKSFELLTTDSEEEARDLANWLNQKNEERQVAMETTQEEAIKKIESLNLNKNKIIIVRGKWHKGVIGPSASKLVEKYNRPVILFADDGDFFTGSARSVSGVNIVKIFEDVKDYIFKFGGHKGAAGITVKKDKFDIFQDNMLQIADKKISNKDLIKRIKVDCSVQMNELTKGLYEKLLLLEPYGMENPKPVFMLEKIKFNSHKFVGKNLDHFSSLVQDGVESAKSIYFNFPYSKDFIKPEKNYDMILNLALDEWQGKSKISLNIIDLKTHG